MTSGPLAFGVISGPLRPRVLGDYYGAVADDDKVVPVDESDIPALEGLVEALMDESQRAQWELLVARAKAGELTPPGRVESKKDAYTWLAWARANLHQAGCMCHRCMAARRVLSGELTGM